MTYSRLYAAVTVAENGKYYAYVIPFTTSDNVLNKLAVNGILHANIYTTKKAAGEVVTAWNNSYKANKTYMFDSPNF